MDAPSPINPVPVEESTRIKSIFVRHRNCLLLTADFSPIYVDYYLHLMKHNMRNAETPDTLLKSMLAYFALHLVSRPWQEYHAWTLNLCQPIEANLFVAGSSLSEDIVGRIFTQDVRVPEQNMLFTQNVRPQREAQNSVVQLKGDTPEQWVESYYQQSEQRLARAFDLGNDQYALITAQPNADHDWLDTLDTETVTTIVEEAKHDEEVKLLETRRFSFRCGCTVEKILPTLKAMAADFADILKRDGQLELSCPRCGALHLVTKDDLKK